MRWARNNLRWLSRLALIALALQFITLSVHLQTGHAAAGIAQPVSADDHHDRNGSSDECAVCAVLHLAGTAVVPDAVATPLPATVSWRWSVVSIADAPLSPAASYHARGPPLT